MNNHAGVGVSVLGVCLYLWTKRKTKVIRRWYERPHLGVENRIKRSQKATLNIMRIHDPESFFRTLRFYPDDFDKLLRMVGPRITKDDTRRVTINPSTRLALTLRFLATGESQRSIAMSYVVGESTARQIISETISAIWETLQYHVMPQPNRRIFEDIAVGFWERWDFPNCGGSIDGKLIRIKMPPHSGSDFFCYKGYHAMILLAVCDYRYRFVIVDTGAQGRQSDGGVFTNSRLGQKLKSNTLGLPPPKDIPYGPSIPYFLLGDEAFGLSTFMINPYPGRSTGELSYTKQIFNYRQSRARRVIENTFGIYVSTWRIFKTEIDASCELVDNIVLATTCLHNFRLILNDERKNRYIQPHFLDEESDGVLIPGSWRNTDSDLDQIAKQLGRHSSAEAVQIRDDLADYFLAAGSVPWQHQMI